jgi:hypothetical protein
MPPRKSRTTDSSIVAKSAEFLFLPVPRLAACGLPGNTRTTESPIVAKSAEFLFLPVPQLAACALVRILSKESQKHIADVALIVASRGA